MQDCGKMFSVILDSSESQGRTIACCDLVSRELVVILEHSAAKDQALAFNGARVVLVLVVRGYELLELQDGG